MHIYIAKYSIDIYSRINQNCKLILTSFIFFSLSIGGVNAKEVEKNYRTLMNLLDYIGRDYSNAVQNDTVINAFEYNEMIEFSRQSIEYFRNLSIETNIEDSALMSFDLIELRNMIDIKKSAESIAKKTTELKSRMLGWQLVKNSPENWPDLSIGANLYQKYCATCHGKNGDGKGIASAGLNPAPSSFINEELMGIITPLQAYNTIISGVPGTAMIAFDQLSNEEVWSLSFYILSMRFDEGKAKSVNPENGLVSLDEAATLSDNELQKRYSEIESFSIEGVRNYKISAGKSTSLGIALKYLDLSLKAYKNNDPQKAGDFSLQAYLLGIEPVEMRIMATDAKLVARLELKMMAVREAIHNQESVELLEQKINEAILIIDEAEDFLGSQERSVSLTAFLAASILVREGLEAFLIIIAMLGVLRSMNAQKAIYWVHGGWITALLVGIGGWFFIDGILSFDVKNRELMEGLIALFAVIILIYAGFWLHSKTEISKWKLFVDTKIKGLVEKNSLFGLAFFSFIVVFREAFESVIFLSSLRLESGSERSTGIWIGIVIAAVIVLLISYGILKFYNKISLRKVFLYTSIVISVLAVILTGDGIHALQEGGFVTASSSFIDIRISFLGIYPSLECFFAQFTISSLIIVLWLYNNKKTSFVQKE